MLDKLDPYENPTPNGMAILSNFKLTIYNFPCDVNVTNHNLTFAACIIIEWIGIVHVDHQKHDSNDINSKLVMVIC